jgi:hypothetical protein
MTMARPYRNVRSSLASSGREAVMTLEPATDLLAIELEHLLTLPDGRDVEWEAIGTGTEPLVWVEGGPGLPSNLARADGRRRSRRPAVSSCRR